MADTNKPSPFDRELAEALCSLEIPKQIKFSPDGQKIVYTTSFQSGGLRKGKHATSKLWLASASGPGSARPLTSGKTRDNSPAWHPDGNRVAFLSDRGDPGSGRAIWMLRLDGGDAVQISDSGSKSSIARFAFSPSGDVIAYTSADEISSEQKEREEKNGGAADPAVWGQDTSQHARLRLLDVKTRETRTLDTGKGHVIEFHWSPDGTSVIVGTVANMDSEEVFMTGTTIATVAVESGEKTEVCVAGVLGESLTWAPDGKVYFIDTAVKGSYLSGAAVYSVDPAETQATPVMVASGDEDDASSLVVSGGKVFVSRNVRMGTLISDISGKRIFEKPVVFYSWDIAYDAKRSSWTVAANLSDINTPAEVVVARHDVQSPIVLSQHGKVFEDRTFGSFHVLSCPSSDGEVELDGIYLAPTGQIGSDQGASPAKPLPTVVFIHGGPIDRDFNRFDPSDLYWASYLLAKGYAVLMPQYRGSYGRGSHFASYSRTGHGRENYDDVITITNHAIRKGFADEKRLLVSGWSMGGLLTYLCCVRNGQHELGWHFNAAVSGGGICDMDSLALTSDLGSTVLTELGGGQAPWTVGRDVTSARRGSALWEVAGAVAEAHRTGKAVIPPILILHGDQDNRAPFTQSQGFRRALRAHNLPHEFVSYPGQGHTPSPMLHWVDMLERVARWCDVYIGPGVSLPHGVVNQE